MKKIFILTFLSALLCSPTFAQTEEQSVPKDSIVEDQIVDQSEYVTEEGPAENYAEEAEVTANDSTITDVDTYSNDATETLMDEKNVTEAYTPSSTGPNRKWHRQIYLQLGFMADNPNAGAAIRYGLSTQWGFGFRIKRRLNNTFALTNDWGYRSTTFNLKQENTKIVPDLKQHRTEKIDFHSITTALHLRINVGRRGNYVGNFLDLGGYGGYA